MAGIAEIPGHITPVQREIIEALQTVPATANPQEYAEELARKTAEDIFSGDPFNTTRQFKLYNEAIAGIGHANSAHDIGGGGPKSAQARAEKARQQAALDAFLHTLSLARIENHVSALFAPLDNKIAHLENMIEEEKKRALRIEDKADELEKKGIITQDTRERITKHNENAKREIETIEAKIKGVKGQLETAKNLQFESLKNLPAEWRDMAMEAASVAKDAVMVEADIEGTGQTNHILHKNEQGQYYVMHPETGQPHILEDQQAAAMAHKAQDGKLLGNSIPSEKVAGFNEIMQEFADIAEQTPRLQNTFENVKQSFSDITKFEQMLDHFQSEIEQIKTRQQELEQKIDMLKEKAENKPSDATQEEIQRYEVELAELNQNLVKTLDKLDVAMQVGTKRMAENLASYDSNITTLRNEYFNLEIEKLAVEREGQLQDKRLLSYGGRHEQLESHYGNGFVNWIIDVPGGKSLTTAGAFLIDKLNLDKLPGVKNMEAVEAWKNHIKHDGESVYRDNITGALYTFSENDAKLEGNDGRTYIADRQAVRTLYAQAYGDPPKLFMNETPNSEDPNNSFGKTLGAMLDAKTLRNQHGENVIENLDREMAQTQANIDELERAKTMENRIVNSGPKQNSELEKLSMKFEQFSLGNYSPVLQEKQSPLQSLTNTFPQSAAPAKLDEILSRPDSESKSRYSAQESSPLPSLEPPVKLPGMS